MEAASAPLSEAELDELEALLEAAPFADQAMGLDQIQAMLCAVASGPAPLPPSRWLPEALGPVAGADEAVGARLVALVLRLYQQIRADLQRQVGVAPILYPLDAQGEALDYATWADAYLFGASLAEPAWQVAAGAHRDDLAELLEAFFLLNGMLKEDARAAGDAWLSPAEEARWLAEVEASLPDVVQAIHDFWAALRDIPAPLRREAPKVGRNDPCPCGSGRKFKQCCGR